MPGPSRPESSPASKPLPPPRISASGVPLTAPAPAPAAPSDVAPPENTVEEALAALEIEGLSKLLQPSAREAQTIENIVRPASTQPQSQPQSQPVLQPIVQDGERVHIRVQPVAGDEWIDVDATQAEITLLLQSYCLLQTSGSTARRPILVLRDGGFRILNHPPAQLEVPLESRAIVASMLADSGHSGVTAQLKHMKLIW